MNDLGRGRRWMLLCGVVTLILLAGTLLARAEGLPLSLETTVAPATVLAGQPITYTLTLRNTSAADVLGVRIQHRLPDGFTYVAGSTQILNNDTLIARTNPTVLTNTLTWSGVDGARCASYFSLWHAHLCAGSLRERLLQDAARPRS